MKALIDGDVIVYAAGFSSDSAARNDEFGAEECEPFSFCMNRVHTMIDSIMEAAEATDMQIYLSGKGNFRLDIYPDYKANRVDRGRPYWYDRIRTTLMFDYDAIEVDGMEADDALGINHHQQHGTVICTNDKDLDNVPGLHYNWSQSRKDIGVYMLTELESLKHFYTQILTGDSTDYIPGMYKLTGKMATPKIKQPIQEMTCEEDMLSYVREVYKEYGGLGIADFSVYADCLWILQPDQLRWSERIKERYSGLL